MNADSLEHLQWLQNGCTQRLRARLVSELSRIHREAENLAAHEANPAEEHSDRIIRSKLSRAWQLRQVLEFVDKQLKNSIEGE